MFSAPVYIRGFIRTCATLLKLDVPQVMSALEGELGQTVNFREPPPVDRSAAHAGGFRDAAALQGKPAKERGYFGRIGNFAGLSVFAVAVNRHSRRTNPLVGLKPGIYQPSNSGETLPIPCVAPLIISLAQVFRRKPQAQPRSRKQLRAHHQL